MSSLNKVTIIGNVGKDPEMRFSSSGKPIVSFSVAVNSKYGEQESTEWFNIVAWDKLAETCNQFLTKGQQVYVEGRLQTRKWEGKDGGTKYKAELVANKVLFLDKRKDVNEEDAEKTNKESQELEDMPV